MGEWYWGHVDRTINSMFFLGRCIVTRMQREMREEEFEVTCAHQVDHESLVLGSNLGLAKLVLC